MIGSEWIVVCAQAQKRGRYIGWRFALGEDAYEPRLYMENTILSRLDYGQLSKEFRRFEFVGGVVSGARIRIRIRGAFTRPSR